MSEATRAEVCAVALADAFRSDGEILASPMGNLPTIGVRLAKRTFAPDLLISDGVSMLMANVVPLGVPGVKPVAEPVVEGWVPYRTIFDIVWSGRRHVIMGATQIDLYGNQNIACIGDFSKPKAQLLGVRGAPGNTINHTTSYWVSDHTAKCFVKQVDVVSGVGYDRARALGERSSRFHEIRRVVTNLCVLDFNTPDHRMRLASVHPGVSVATVVENTGFELVVPAQVPETRWPTPEELRILREEIDPNGLGAKEVKV